VEVRKFTPKHLDPPGSLYQDGTIRRCCIVEIEVTNKEAVRGWNYYSWAMPVYEDSGGLFISFQGTHLKSILGKMYLSDLGYNAETNEFHKEGV